MRSHIAPIVIHETPTTVSAWRLLVDLQKKYFMENEMQNTIETNPVTTPVKHARSLEYAAGIEVFRSEILKAGLSLPNEIIDDGRIHRFSSNGKPTDNAGWYVLFTDGIAAGAFGCWREDVKINWCSVDKATLTQSEMHEFNKKMAEAKKLREHEEEINRTKARSKASKIWEQSAEAPTDHPYLLSKKVQPHGLKLSRGNWWFHYTIKIKSFGPSNSSVLMERRNSL